MNIGYILPRADFFTRGINGSVTHAKGISNGLSKVVEKIVIYSGLCSDKYISSENIQHVNIESDFLFNLALIRKLFINRKALDFVIVRYSTKWGWFYCMALNVLFRNRWAFEVNSFGFQQLSNVETGNHSLLCFALKRIELYVIKRSFIVNCVSDSLTKIIRNDNLNVFTLPNASYVNNKLFESVAFDGSASKVKLVYMGLFHSYYDLVSIVNSVKLMSSLEVELHLYGEGELSHLMEQAANKSRNIYFHGRYKFDEVVSKGALDGKTFLILPYKDKTIANFGSPTKLFEYLSLGLPIISTKVGQPYQLLADVDFVYFYENDISELINIIGNDIHVDRKEILKYFANNHTWDARCSFYLSEIKSRINLT
ncbi:glycosyltransferase [Vibrio cyclitrophicus]